MSEKPVFDPQRFKRDQRKMWSDAAAGWRKWWSTFEAAAQHVSDRLVALAELNAGAKVLDVATGIGEPAVTAARRVGPTGRVIAIDQAPGMLAIARERAAALGLSNIEFREADVEGLEIAERDFDAVLCRWGLMFMPELDRVVASLCGRLSSHGRFATAVWATPDKVPLISLGAAAVREIAGLPPPATGTPDPMRLADTSILARALEGAGMRAIVIERVPVTFAFESNDALLDFRLDVSSQFRAMLADRPPEIRERIRTALREAVLPYASGGQVRLINEAICISARH